ncbi:DNA-binding MarR family transcriptional regulator [Cytobacillus firmus]|uniref:DNA-binding MarR family transcriptional regulator n=2 Tax=Cytobacillus TaxID=2675230 RepID=A0A366K2D6_CYTFI|nr:MULTISPECIES: MarR family transcriptional regulator [Cytobacillus]RBP95916.1 DNA-binding MarR family transcriptional regulator [Cytobacillus firmus]TDX44829.1 DNA-binding MarR family transcriptional regulator [Cytobacillus oceanisediminis]
MKTRFNDYISIKIHQIDLTLTSYIKDKLAHLNIAPEQNLILMLLWEEDGLSQNEIARRLDKDKSNITRMLSSLEKKGFIKKSMNKEDSRSLNVYLTENGKNLSEHVYPITEEFHSIVTSGIAKEELRIVEDVLTKMRRNVEGNK